MEQSNLYIPVNIKTRFEFFDGYGVSELPPTVAAAISSGLAAFVVHAFAGTVPAVLTVLVTVAASVTALAKGENNMSAVDHAKCLLRFTREQQDYPYRHTEEWGDEN
jgi:hypothetical protein